MASGEGLTIMEYNVENFFDCSDDSLKDDAEFLPDSPRHWTFSRYWKKANDIAKVIAAAGFPDIIGLCEVENDSAMVMLTRKGELRGARYEYVMTDSPDQRGVDVAMLYNPLTVRLLYKDTLRVTPPTGGRPTRDILHCAVSTIYDSLPSAASREGRRGSLHLFVLHAPSRSGGARASEPYRLKVINRLLECVDTIRQADPEARIVVMGDFNDYSYNRSLKMLKQAGLIEASEHAVGINNPYDVLGTYKFQGKWDSLDHIFLSGEWKMENRKWEMDVKVLDLPWLLEAPHGRLQVNRTYQGTHYHGGTSDHLPLIMTLSSQP